MKMNYEKPIAIFDEFVANQFIAACSEIITDNHAGMNCVNPNHYVKGAGDLADTNSNKYHTANGKTAAQARVNNVFTDKSFGCGTCIPSGSTFSVSSNPKSGMVYPFNGSGGMDYSTAVSYDYCFGAYINKTSSSTTTQPFSA